MAGENVAVPSGVDAALDLMITMNDVGAFLWGRLARKRTREELAQALLDPYALDEDRAVCAVRTFWRSLKRRDFQLNDMEII